MTSTDTQRETQGASAERQTRPERLVRRQGGAAFLPPGASTASVRSCHLVTEDLDLADSAVHQALGGGATVIGVDLQVQGDTLYPLLR